MLEVPHPTLRPLGPLIQDDTGPGCYSGDPVVPLVLQALLKKRCVTLTPKAIGNVYLPCTHTKS
jgi:hypothetical protein